MLVYKENLVVCFKLCLDFTRYFRLSNIPNVDVVSFAAGISPWSASCARNSGPAPEGGAVRPQEAPRGGTSAGRAAAPVQGVPGVTRQTGTLLRRDTV